jgi:8-oxo-dGTP diphosphatase
MEPIDVLCAVILRDGKVLAAKRAPGKARGGLWEFPGGKREPGETERAGIVREIYEELGIEVAPVVRLTPNLYRYPDVHIRLIPFLVNHVRGEEQCREHDELRWCTRQELDRLRWAPADEPIVDEVLGYALWND